MKNLFDPSTRATNPNLSKMILPPKLEDSNLLLLTPPRAPLRKRKEKPTPLEILDNTETDFDGYLVGDGSNVAAVSTIPHTDITGLGTLATQSGTFSGTSSGTNTGDQTITLTGDVTGSGTGSFSATIANDAVTFTKMQDVSTDVFLGRDTAGSGNVEELSVSTAKTLLNLANTNSGDVTLAGENYLSLSGQQVTAGSVSLSGTNVTGTLAAARFPALTGDVTTSAGSVSTTITNDAVTFAKIQDVSTDVFLGRDTAGTGDVEELSVSTAKTLLNLSGTNTGDQTITLTGNVTGSGTGSFATTIAAGAVTNSMLAGSIAASKLVGTDIATVGTVTTGTWSGTTVAVNKGGTGQTTAGAAINALLPTQTAHYTLQTDGTDPVFRPKVVVPASADTFVPVSATFGIIGYDSGAGHAYFGSYTSNSSGVVTSRNTVIIDGAITWLNGRVRLTQTSPSQITSNQNNYANPSAAFVRLTSDAARTITGVVAGTGTEYMTFVNVGSFTITLSHESGSSTAANRFACPGAVDYSLTAGKSVPMFYDVTSSRWRLVVQ